MIEESTGIVHYTRAKDLIVCGKEDYYIHIVSLLLLNYKEVKSIVLKDLLNRCSITLLDLKKIFPDGCSILTYASLFHHADLLIEVIDSLGVALLNIADRSDRTPLDYSFLPFMNHTWSLIEFDYRSETHLLKNFNTVQVLLKCGSIIPKWQACCMIEEICLFNRFYPPIVLIARHLEPGYWNMEGLDSQTLTRKKKCREIFEKRVSGWLLTDREIHIYFSLKLFGLIDDIFRTIIRNLIPMTDIELYHKLKESLPIETPCL